MHYMDADQVYREKAWRQDAASSIKQIQEAASHKAASVWTPCNQLDNHAI